MAINKRRPPPLEPNNQKRVSALIARAGERRACDLLGMPKSTLARAAAGLGIRRATADVIVARLDALDDGAAVRRAVRK